MPATPFYLTIWNHIIFIIHHKTGVWYKFFVKNSKYVTEHRIYRQPSGEQVY